MPDYRNLDVWKLAHELTLSVYRVTHTYPVDERFGLITQTRRAIAAIPANIAEGAGRFSDRNYGRFVAIAAGSANEAEYHLLLAKDLGYLKPQTWEAIDGDLARIRAMLTGLRRRLRDESPAGQ